ncbi:MAG TPA: TIGR04211 family SH3 domain-containing protein [Halomonas sp.]|nr:TIGR04211 family SH3 domain-containing protein [Halomonas sp.]
MALGLTALPLHAQEAAEGNRWVSEELTTWVRSGPTDGYRIVGTLTAGESVTVLESSGDYTRVENGEGDEAWILTDELQGQPSAQNQLPRLEQQVEELQTELDDINTTWEERVSDMTQTLQAREQQIGELKEENEAYTAATDESSQTIRRLQARLDTQEEDLLIRYFMYGGGVAGAGLLVGLIVPHLPRRRKKSDRWF